MEKIELGSETNEVKAKSPEVAQDYARQTAAPISMRKRKNRFSMSPKSMKIIGGIVVFLVIAGIFTGTQAYAVYKSAIVTYKQAKLFANAMKVQDIELASTELVKTKADLTDTQKKLGHMFYLHFIPVANFYYNDATHMMNAGSAGLDSAGIAVDALKPYADVLGLKGGGSFAGGSAEDRIRTAVLTMGKITPRIDDIAKSLDIVQKEIDQVNPAHYPKLIFGSKISSSITQAKELTDAGATFVHNARPLVKVLPELLGEKEDKKYLIIFQNNAELRPTGGFITAYAIFRISKGNITVDRSDDIYSLDASIPKGPAPRPIVQYLPKVYTFNLRDSNLSPDYIESMKTFYEMYQKSSQKVPVDGIIALDTSVLVSTVKILDNHIEAGGLTFNTDPDPRCWNKCPQIIYQLEDSISRPVNYIKSDRKGLLGELLYAIMKKALQSSPKVYWGPLVQSMITEAQQKHVLFNLFNADAQTGIDSLNASGRIKAFDNQGDYLHINDTNFAGAKSNLFITQTVRNEYKVESDGSIIKTVTVEYTNPEPPSDCNLERGALCLNAENRDWVRFYVPKGSQLIAADSKGSQVKLTTYDELGKTVIEGFLTVRTQGKSTYKVSYKLPFKKPSNGVVPLLIQKQAGTDSPMYTDVINGHEEKPFALLTDQEVKIQL
jgi:hypothetical protein